MNGDNKGKEQQPFQKQGADKKDQEKNQIITEPCENALDFPVVGVGASAGGLEALQDFFKNMPDNPGTAFVIIQHLSPDYKSLMDELLARHTNMKIHRVKDGMELKPNHIFLIPPRKNMTIFKGRLYLSEQDYNRAINMPIDIFLRSLAQDQGKNAIGIILSGTGSDGTLGIRAIKENGGMVIAQDDRSAKFDGMPRSSISTGMVDYILTSGEMPEALINFIKHPFIQKTEKIENQITQDEDYLAKIIMIIRDVTGIDFSNYKESTIIRRLEKRISINRYDRIEDYVDFISGNKREINILYRELLIGVTRFFRDHDAFNKLKELVVPKILINHTSRQPIRIWCIGCSTGEEAYSLAILLKEYMEEQEISREVKLFATDIDKDAVEYAGTGIYPESIVSDISAERLSKYFTRKEDGYQINESIRSMVVFATHNILKDPPFSKIDLISCRNMLIYLNSEIQQKVLSMLYFSLNKEGFLFLGSSESVGEMSSGYSIIDNKTKIYKYQTGYTPPANEFYRIPQLKKKTKNHQTLGTYYNQPKSKFPTIDHIFDDLLSEFVPPSVMVDENYNIVHTIHNVNKYLNIPVGQFTMNILKMLPDELATMVSTILRRSRKNKQQVVFENLRMPGAENQLLDVSGRMLEDKKTREIYFLISFKDHEKKNPNPVEKGDVEKFDLDNQYQERINELEKELQYTRESLQATVEELETSNEELQSSNEELIASNEELQSTNEELQSVNEELYTVNGEHQQKIEELTQLNNDMNNLLRNTQIGTLFIDNQLHIRKLTEVAESITNIRTSDIGRPIEHISLDHIDPHFVADIHEVLENLTPKEREIQTKDKNWYLIRIVPYRTAENAVDGIIITLIDISKLKNSQEEIYTLNSRLEKAMQIGGLAWWEWDYQNNRVTFGHQKATMLGYQPEEIEPGFEGWTRLLHPDDYEPVMQNMRDHIKGKVPIYEVKYRLKNKQGEYIWFKDQGGILEKDDHGTPLKISGIVTNINREKQIEAEKNKTYELIYNTLTYNPVASTIVDKNGTITFANKKAEALLGITQKQIRERSFDDQKWKITDLEGNTIPPENLPFSKVMHEKQPIHDYQHYIQRPGKGKRLLSINGAPMYDQHAKINGVVFTLQDITEEHERENAIKQSEHKYRSLFNRNRDAILVADKNRNIIDANPALENLVEYKLEEIKGQKTAYLYANESDYQDMGKALKQYNNSPGFLKLILYKKKNGDVFYGETSTFSLTDAEGQISDYVGLIRDVTEKLQREKDKIKWARTVGILKEGIVLLDKQYNILQYNQAFLDIIGIPDDNIHGKKSYELIHGTDKPPKNCFVCKAMEKKKHISDEYYEPNLKKHLRVSVDPVYDEAGNFEFTVYTLEVLRKDNNLADQP